jgi:signal transduction histidine kinase
VLLAEIIAAARAEMPPGAATWNDDVEPSDLRVRAHPGLFTRVLHALYDNAVQVSAPRAPAIATRARIESGRVVLEIEDDGPGVPAALAPHIFDPLVTGRSGGTGLGLALAKRIVSAHGGSIALLDSGDSGQGERRGARFRLAI